jgi:hypothetical protein
MRHAQRLTHDNDGWSVNLELGQRHSSRLGSSTHDSPAFFGGVSQRARHAPAMW